MNMTESFNIDDGELDGLSPQECFVLGVEWQMVRSLADGDSAFKRPVHMYNRDRLIAVLESRGRVYTLSYMHEDSSETYMYLAVEAKQ